MVRGSIKMNLNEQLMNIVKDLFISKPVAYRAIAPTGTIGILAGTTTGIEPLFAVAYKRRYLTDGTKWKYEYVIDSTADLLIKQYGIDPNTIETAYGLSSNYEQRIKFQADIQDYVDMSISSTINLPSWGSKKMMKDLSSALHRRLLRMLPGSEDSHVIQMEVEEVSL
jgi:ribonucleoside-diphosphate reductase alpha chain